MKTLKKFKIEALLWIKSRSCARKMGLIKLMRDTSKFDWLFDVSYYNIS